MTDVEQLRRPFGMRWGIGYALVKPEAPVCGFFVNPEAERIWELRWCGLPAVYGFRFGELSGDGWDVLGSWNGVCPEHAAAMRERGEVLQMWTL